MKVHAYKTQRTQPKMKNILFHTAKTTYTSQVYVSYMPNNLTNKDSPKEQNKDINVDFTTNTKFILLQLRQRKLWSIHIQISQ